MTAFVGSAAMVVAAQGMILAEQSNSAQVITAVAALVTAITAPITVWMLHDTRKQVRTFNDTAIGPLAAQDETRRINEIPRGERTAKEQRHVDDAPPADPPQGPPR